MRLLKKKKIWWSKTSSKIVKVNFEYGGEKFIEKKTYLIAQKADKGDEVVISINPKKASDFKPFYPKFEVLALGLVFGIGIGLLWFSILAVEWLS